MHLVAIKHPPHIGWTGTGPLPATLDVPGALAAALQAAVATGREEAAGWARIHPTGSTNRFDRDAVANAGTPPAGDAARADLDAVRAAKLARTPDAVEAAVWHQQFGGWDLWANVIDELRSSHGVEQARRAERLVNLAQARTDAVTATVKEQFDRKRPYEVDPTIDPVVHRPDGNASFPSGHSSGAFAAAIVLAALVPERAAELMSLASQVAYSRVLGGVHFPSDVAAGARIASRIASDVLRRDGLVAS